MIGVSRLALIKKRSGLPFVIEVADKHIALNRLSHGNLHRRLARCRCRCL